MSLLEDVIKEALAKGFSFGRKYQCDPNSCMADFDFFVQDYLYRKSLESAKRWINEEFKPKEPLHNMGMREGL
jgi:hypothetical protein